MLKVDIIKAIRLSYDDSDGFRDCRRNNDEYVRGQLEFAVNLLGLEGADDTEIAMERLVAHILHGWN